MEPGGNSVPATAQGQLLADIVAKRFLVLERRTIFSHLDRNLEF